MTHQELDQLADLPQCPMITRVLTLEEVVSDRAKREMLAAVVGTVQSRTFGQLLREERRRAGESSCSLAKAIGCSVTELSAIEMDTAIWSSSGQIDRASSASWAPGEII